VYGYGNSRLLRAIAEGRRQEALRSIPKYLDQAQQREALKLACGKGDVELTEALLKRRSLSENDDVDMLMPLHVAALSNNLECARMLLDAGANATAKEGRGIQPTHLAASPEMIRLLLKNGADLGASDSLGMGVLPYWSFWGFSQNVSLMRSLLHSNAFHNESDVSYVHPDRTLLHHAGSAEVVNVLVKSESCLVDSPSDAKSGNGWTPLHSAVERENLSVMAALLRAGANPNAKDLNANTPLSLAAGADNAVAVGLLLLNGASAEEDMENAGPGTETKPAHVPPWIREFVPGEMQLRRAGPKDEVRIMLESVKVAPR
jgi:cytohesin